MGSLKFFKNNNFVLKQTACQTTYLCWVVSDVRVLIQKLHEIKSNQINFNFYFQFELIQFNSNVIRNKIF